jgi:SEC-C motif-containing protein
MTLCPCQSGQNYDDCCGAIIAGRRAAPTAEALMRSRYSAFARGELDYLHDSLHPDHRGDHDPEATRQWAERSEWLTLEILSKQAGGEDDDSGTVEFAARFRQKGATLTHHEVGEFSRLNGRWYYVDGRTVTPGTVRNAEPKVGRNDPCPCGSGKKYKKCCGR